MKYAVYPQPVLGPCGCQTCGEPLYWARRNTRVDNVVVGSLRWRDWTGRIHKCSVRPARLRLPGGRGRPKSQIRHESIHHGLARARANGYNDNARTSSTQVDFRVDAVPLLVPGGAASLRYEGRD